MATQRQSLRKHVWRVVFLIALAPLLFVTLGIPFDKLVAQQLESRAMRAADACLEAVKANASCRDIANEMGALVRVYRGDQLVEETDAASAASVGWMESLLDVEADQWLLRYEPKEVGCHVRAFGRLRVCKELRTRDDVHVVSVTGDVRSIRALSSDGVTKLALQVLLVALLVGWWLGRRIVLPMEHLRDSVLARKGESAYDPILTEDETEVGEVADAFNELLGELDERRRANEAFAADLAHDLKTPIATILASAENLEQASDLTTENAQSYARMLRRNGERMNAIVGDFLELARAEAGLEHSEREAVDIGDLLSAIVGQLDDESTARIDLDVVSASVHGSPRHLQTAFTNVLENALQVTSPDGRVEVRVEAGEDVVVVVRDDGPGIDPEDLDRVFERFFSQRGGGTGLGLPLARAIARAHGGELTVYSSPGEGATFTFRLQSHQSHTQVTEQ